MVDGREASGRKLTSSAATNSDGSSSLLVQPPAISLPKRGGAIRGIGEKFAANPVTGPAPTADPTAAPPRPGGVTLPGVLQVTSC
jgi:hypothetical protein